MEPEGSSQHSQNPATCSCPETGQFNSFPYPISLRSILFLPFHLRVGIPGDLSPSDFFTKILYAPLLFPMRAKGSVHLIFLDLITCSLAPNILSVFYVTTLLYNIKAH